MSGFQDHRDPVLHETLSAIRATMLAVSALREGRPDLCGAFLDMADHCLSKALAFASPGIDLAQLREEDTRK